MTNDELFALYREPYIITTVKEGILKVERLGTE